MPFIAEQPPQSTKFERAPTRPARISPPDNYLSSPTAEGFLNNFSNGSAIPESYLSTFLDATSLNLTEERPDATPNSLLEQSNFNSPYVPKLEDFSCHFEREASPVSEYGTSSTAFNERFSFNENPRDTVFNSPYHFSSENKFEPKAYYSKEVPLELMSMNERIDKIGQKVNTFESQLCSSNKMWDRNLYDMQNEYREIVSKRSIMKHYESKNIFIGIRCRPFPKVDKSFKINYDSSIIVCGKEIYHPDHIFPPSTSQEQIFDTVVNSMMSPILDGKNFCTICMGPTFTGKSYTLGLNIKTSKDFGIIPRFIENLAFSIEMRKNTEFRLSVSFIKIQDDNVVDMLNSANYGVSVISAKEGNYRIVGATEEEVIHCKDILGYLPEEQDKSIEEKAYSRGHLAFEVKVSQRHFATQQVMVSRVLFVELADLKDDAGMSSLELVLDAVANRQQDIPYNVSQLTTLLESAIGGNSITSIFACLPAITNEDVVYYLELIEKARSIRNFPTINVYENFGGQKAQALNKSEMDDLYFLREHNKILQEEIRRTNSELAYMHNRNVPYAIDRGVQIANDKERLIHTLETLKDKVADIVIILTHSMNNLSPDLPEKINLLMELQFKTMDIYIKLHFWYNTNGHLKGTKIYVGCVPENCKSEDIRPLFEQFGTVNECDVLHRYAFVHMSTPEEAQNAINSLNHLHFRGCYLKVQHSISNPKPSSTESVSSFKSEFRNFKRGGGTSGARFPRPAISYTPNGNRASVISKYEDSEYWAKAS